MAKAPSLSMAQRLLLASQSMAPVAVKAALVQKLGPEQARANCRRTCRRRNCVS
jgi:hypothetical protein